jgi:hypothetical protein
MPVEPLDPTGIRGVTPYLAVRNARAAKPAAPSADDNSASE